VWVNTYLNRKGADDVAIDLVGNGTACNRRLDRHLREELAKNIRPAHVATAGNSAQERKRCAPTEALLHHDLEIVAERISTRRCSETTGVTTGFPNDRPAALNHPVTETHLQPRERPADCGLDQRLEDHTDSSTQSFERRPQALENMGIRASGEHQQDNVICVATTDPHRAILTFEQRPQTARSGPRHPELVR
jgi:hypothetical protein